MKRILSMMCAAAVVLSLVACSGSKSAESTASSSTASSVVESTASSTDETAAAEGALIFSGTTIDGSTVDQSVLAGHKLSMLNIWFTECKYCIEEMPALEAISQSYDSADFQIIGICSNPTMKEDYLAETAEVLEQVGVTYMNFVPDEATEEALVQYTDYMYPTTLFVDENGEILDILQGSRSEDAWRAAIEEELAKRG
ncbi:MAG: TlpA disulfide reductase family protein [Faecalibacterium sp.]